MGVIGTLQLNIAANTKGLSDGFKRARKESKTFQGSMQRSLGGISKFGAGIAGVLGVGGLAGLSAALLKAAGDLDKLGKTADKLGLTTQALAGLRLAGERTGVATNTMDMALQRMVRRLSEANKGTGEAVKALQELGIEAGEIAKLSADKQFAQIADSLSKVENQADKVRLAFKFFDSEGVALVNTLNLGSEGLDRMSREAEKLGLAVSRENISKVEKFNDAIINLKKAAGAAFQELLINVAPKAVWAIEKLTWLVQKGGLVADLFTPGTPVDPKPIGAALRSSASGAFNRLSTSMIPRHQEQLAPAPMLGKQLEEQRQSNTLLQDIADGIRNPGPRALKQVAIIPQ